MPTDDATMTIYCDVTGRSVAVTRATRRCPACHIRIFLAAILGLD